MRRAQFKPAKRSAKSEWVRAPQFERDDQKTAPLERRNFHLGHLPLVSGDSFENGTMATTAGTNLQAEPRTSGIDSDPESQAKVFTGKNRTERFSGECYAT